MAIKILRVRRGTSAQLEQYKGPTGEPVFNIDTKMLHMQDALTDGGIPLMNANMPKNTIKGAIMAGQAQDLRPEQVRQITGQVWKQIEVIELSVAVWAIVLEIPPDIEYLKLTYSLWGALNTSIICRYSTDGGLTFKSGAEDYANLLTVFTQPGSISSNPTTASNSIIISNGMGANKNIPLLATAVIRPGGANEVLFIKADWFSSNDTYTYIGMQASSCARYAGRATHLQIFSSSGLLSVGSKIIMEGC